MKLLIIDSNALLHRSFHALPPLADSKGEQTGAIYGFLLTFLKAINDIKPNFVVATFDTPSPTFRHKKFKEYKAKRKKAPDEFYAQIPKTKEVLSAMSVSFLEKQGFEADDVIATVTKETKKQEVYPEVEIYILTGDFDTLQLVDKNTKVYTLGKGIKETVVYDKKKVFERFGILPKQMVDFKALAGDPSDNIPGATGVGKKTAADLLQRFGNLENLYKKIEEKGNGNIKPRIEKLLGEQKEQVFFSRILAKAREDVPIKFKLREFKIGHFDDKKIKNVLEKYRFFSLVKRIPELRGEKAKNYLSQKKQKVGEDDFVKNSKDGKLF